MSTPFCPDVRRSGSLYLFDEVPYLVAWQWQQQLVAAYKASKLSGAELSEAKLANADNDRSISKTSKDSLLLLQHPPVYTLGQGADTRFLRFDPAQTDYELYRIERGGEVTYHCPGQLVAYPILDLHHYRQDLHWYLRSLEEVIIRTLACYGLRGERIAGMTGVWVEGFKVAAMGIKVSRWITMHGFSLNVCPDLTGFERIVPCGIEGKPVGAIAQFIPQISVAAVQDVVVEQFEQVFKLTLDSRSVEALKAMTEHA
ncbi:MAG: lipoyl(octanoyl) transferase LipB [Phormidesmis sp.]